MRFFLSFVFAGLGFNRVLAQSLDYSTYTDLLHKYVSAEGKVNYTELKKHTSDLDKIIIDFSENPVPLSASKRERLAYWINVYNANTLKLVISHYPIKSIMDINSGKPWDLKMVQSGKDWYSLNQIENEIIRPQFKDARIHFALNCAALSCPSLLNKAYTAGDLDQVLDVQTKKFLNSTKNNIKVSKLFDWYKDDFGSVIDFINTYADKKLDKNTKLDFAEYNWALNQ